MAFLNSSGVSLSVLARSAKSLIDREISVTAFKSASTITGATNPSKLKSIAIARLTRSKITNWSSSTWPLILGKYLIAEQTALTTKGK